MSGQAEALCTPTGRTRVLGHSGGAAHAIELLKLLPIPFHQLWRGDKEKQGSGVTANNDVTAQCWDESGNDMRPMLA